MATMTGMKCLHCEKRKAKPDSHYCGKKCSTAFVKAMQGPVDCVGGRWYACIASRDRVDDAKRDGWVGIEADPEGAHWNYTGYCPDCKGEWSPIAEQGELFA